MQQGKYEDERYQEWIRLLTTKRIKYGWNWEVTRLLGKKSEEAAWQYITNQDEDIYYPFAAPAEWQEFVAYYQQQVENSQPAVLARPSERGSGDRLCKAIPGKPWYELRHQLEQQGHMPIAAIDVLEKNARLVLNQLADGSNGAAGPVKGLVMGNVQSGKTANMEAVMAMAAELGWNVFVILTGTIESLRQQTERRMSGDLQGGVAWHFLHNLHLQNDAYAPAQLHLERGANDRYVITCLKNTHRLHRLLEWLNYIPDKKAQMRILIIDDESDQASLNTRRKSMDEVEVREVQERTRINDEIVSLVKNLPDRPQPKHKRGRNRNIGNGQNINQTEDKREPIPSLAMNYICYTATPYGNLLNEAGPDSLYPRDFITVLPQSDMYFGPAQIFGDPVDGTLDGLNIVNKVEEPAETDQLELIRKAWDADEHARLPMIPPSLQEAIAWFCVCVAVRRYQVHQSGDQGTHPLSMLVHHSMVTNYHLSIAKAVRQWYMNLSMDAFIALCQRVYDQQTSRLNPQTFSESLPGYGQSAGLQLPEAIEDYPAFAVIEQELRQLKAASMQHITLEGERPVYNQGIHLCVDNSRADSVIPDEAQESYQVRLLYPDSGCSVRVPAFLVVGGNTLARGLTIEGLVSTYFTRTVAQADTLMQMGRWFGYRRGYELLPRIWLTPSVVHQFEQLTEIDIRLRRDILRRYAGEVTPEECGPMIHQLPGLAITAANKMQDAEPAELSFAGAHMQTVEFEDNQATLEHNIKVADAFIDGLGAPVAGLVTAHSRVWHNVPFARIRKDLLEQSVYQLTSQASTAVFCAWFGQVADEYDDWEVIVYGKDSEKLAEIERWHGVGRIRRTRKLTGGREAHSANLSIGVVSDPNVWRADIPRAELDGLSQSEQEQLKLVGKRGLTKAQRKDIQILQQTLRERAGLGRTPRLVMYRIDKDSHYYAHGTQQDGPARSDLAVSADLIALEVLLPGQPGNKNYVAAVTVNMDN